MVDDQVTANGPNEWMRKLVASWSTTNRGRLVEWLRGEGLPAVGDNEEPYTWILRGLPPGRDRKKTAEAMANAIAALLDDGIEEDDDDGLLYNLFELAAGLACPNQLAQALDDAIGRRALGKRDWHGNRLVSALRDAVVENQNDDRHRPMWMRMLKGEPDAYLEGNVADGFHGILWMPPDRGKLGIAARDDLARALKYVATFLDSDPKLHQRRETEFRRFFTRAQNAYLDEISDSDWVELAFKEAWQDYAFRALKLPINDPNRKIYIVPVDYEDLVREYSYPVERIGPMLRIRGIRRDDAAALDARIWPQEAKRREKAAGGDGSTSETTGSH